MKNETPVYRQIPDAKIAPLEERWSPGRENPAVGMDEGILRALARVDEGARRAVQMADNWKGTEVPGNRLDEFFCGLISGKTIKNLASQKKGPEGKHSVGNKKSAYEKWPLTVWFYLRYFCKQEHRGKLLMQIAVAEKILN
jgi:hypothetical protein